MQSRWPYVCSYVAQAATIVTPHSPRLGIFTYAQLRGRNNRILCTLSHPEEVHYERPKPVPIDAFPVQVRIVDVYACQRPPVGRGPIERPTLVERLPYEPRADWWKRCRESLFAKFPPNAAFRQLVSHVTPWFYPCTEFKVPSAQTGKPDDATRTPHPTTPPSMTPMTHSIWIEERLNDRGRQMLTDEDTSNQVDVFRKYVMGKRLTYDNEDFENSTCVFTMNPNGDGTYSDNDYSVVFDKLAPLHFEGHVIVAAQRQHTRATGGDIEVTNIVRRVDFDAGDAITFVQQIGDLPFPVTDDKEPIIFKVLQPTKLAKDSPGLLNSCTQGAAQSSCGSVPKRGGRSRLPGPPRLTFWEQITLTIGPGKTARLNDPDRPLAFVYRLEAHTTARDQQFGNCTILVLTKQTMASNMALARGNNRRHLESTSNAMRESYTQLEPYALRIAAERPSDMPVRPMDRPNQRPVVSRQELESSRIRRETGHSGTTSALQTCTFYPPVLPTVDGDWSTDVQSARHWSDDRPRCKIWANMYTCVLTDHDVAAAAVVDTAIAAMAAQGVENPLEHHSRRQMPFYNELPGLMLNTVCVLNSRTCPPFFTVFCDTRHTGRPSQNERVMSRSMKIVPFGNGPRPRLTRTRA